MGVLLCWRLKQVSHSKWSEERVGWQVCTLEGHSGAVYSVAFSSDGKRVVSGSKDRLVRIWNAETGDEVSSLGG